MRRPTTSATAGSSAGKDLLIGWGWLGVGSGVKGEDRGVEDEDDFALELAFVFGEVVLGVDGRPDSIGGDGAVGSRGPCEGKAGEGGVGGGTPSHRNTF